MSTTEASGQLFDGASGRWATAQFKAAALSGKPMTAAALRTADTLRRDEWEVFDDAVIEEAKIRLVGVGDLMAAGLVKPVTGSLGKTVFGYERVTDMDAAATSLDGLTRTANDRQEFNLNQLPLPITHKDFFLNLRELTASREKGEPLDTTHVRTAGRVVAEQLENMLFNGGPTFGGLTLPGYLTHANRNEITGFTDTDDWETVTKTGASFLTDTLAMIAAAHVDRMFGPYWIYMSAAAGVNLEADFKAESSQTIRQRLEAINNVSAVRVADQVPAGQVLLVQATIDVAAWIQGEALQTVQWDEYGGFKVNFKVFTIGVPLIRADITGRSGIVNLHA